MNQVATLERTTLYSILLTKVELALKPKKNSESFVVSKEYSEWIRKLCVRYCGSNRTNALLESELYQDSEAADVILNSVTFKPKKLVQGRVLTINGVETLFPPTSTLKFTEMLDSYVERDTYGYNELYIRMVLEYLNQQTQIRL